MSKVSKAFFTLAMSLAVPLAATSLAAHAAGNVEVSYVEPQQFSDVGRGIFDRERTLKSLTEYLQTLGRQLPDGQTLRLEVLDINLAGEVEPFAWNELRVLRGGVDGPRMQLRYTLLADGRTLKAGEARLSDMSYLFTRRGYELHYGDLAYEKRMLRQWFDQNFAAPR